MVKKYEPSRKWLRLVHYYYFASCCIFALHEPSFETVIYITLYQQMH